MLLLRKVKIFFLSDNTLIDVRLRKFRGRQPDGPAGDVETQVISEPSLEVLSDFLPQDCGAVSVEKDKFVCFVTLCPKSTAMVMAGRSLHLITLFSWASLNKQLTSTSCTYFGL